MMEKGLFARKSGKDGENHIAKYLKRHGYRVIEMNYHSRFGEIDIIAENRKYIVFVEVKTRAKDGLTAPFEAVTAQKQQKLILTAQKYLQEHPTEKQPRFDVAAVITEGGKIVSEEYLENGFGV